MRLIKFRNPNLRYFEGEDGGGGGVTDSGADNAGDGVTEGSTEPQDSGPGYNPAWEPMLKGIPSSLHPMVTPHLKKWDENFQTEIQKVQSQYEPFKPLLEQGADAETLAAALNFYRLAESEPERVYREMTEYYGFGQDQGQQEPVQDSDELNLGEVDEDPRYAELQKNQEAIAQVLLKQHEHEQMAAFEAQIETEVASIKEAHPDMSEQDEVMMYQLAMANGSTLTEAAQELFKYREAIQQSALAGRSAAPPVMSATGTVPGQQPIDPRKLDSKATKSLVASILANRQ